MRIKSKFCCWAAGIVALLMVVAVIIGGGTMLQSRATKNVFTQTEVSAKILSTDVVPTKVIVSSPVSTLFLIDCSKNGVAVPVEMSLWGNLVLVDLRLAPAEWAYYQDNAQILVNIRYNKTLHRLIIKLHGRKVFDETGHPLCIGG